MARNPASRKPCQSKAVYQIPNSVRLRLWVALTCVAFLPAASAETFDNDYELYVCRAVAELNRKVTKVGSQPLQTIGGEAVLLVVSRER